MAIWLAGIVGGLIAGALMLGGIMTLAPFRGYGEFLTPAKLVAGVVQGATTENSGLGTAALGGAIHLLIAAIFGYAFALLMAGLRLTDFGPYIRFAIVPFSGILYAISLFGGSEFLVLPFIDKPFFKQIHPLDWVLMHMVYGAILGWFVALMA